MEKKANGKFYFLLQKVVVKNMQFFLNFSPIVVTTHYF